MACVPVSFYHPFCDSEELIMSKVFIAYEGDRYFVESGDKPMTAEGFYYRHPTSYSTVDEAIAAGQAYAAERSLEMDSAEDIKANFQGLADFVANDEALDPQD